MLLAVAAIVSTSTFQVNATAQKTSLEFNFRQAYTETLTLPHHTSPATLQASDLAAACESKSARAGGLHMDEPTDTLSAFHCFSQHRFLFIRHHHRSVRRGPSLRAGLAGRDADWQAARARQPHAHIFSGDKKTNERITT
jgi:hypothetical protein